MRRGRPGIDCSGADAVQHVAKLLSGGNPVLDNVDLPPPALPNTASFLMAPVSFAARHA
jgi:hypothetical protein